MVFTELQGVRGYSWSFNRDDRCSAVRSCRYGVDLDVLLSMRDQCCALLWLVMSSYLMVFGSGSGDPG
ncbi:hypothetical protein XF_1281 [Xylella fastidiosa 9a5c]|uniref:Uncharacterized protein n=1 Tax=Xylella fastidiosa (strain 9a5c) TaxID=160492 RepID=Q9PDU8_XYLFA|nr:hypothetical protein XF_1281 [Xylella fastidiosa 9a5c]